MDSNLFKFHKEGKEEFKHRKDRACRDNVSRNIVETFTAHLFKAPITRDFEKAPESIKQFAGQATRGHNRMDLETFMRTVSDRSSVVSPLYVVVDMPTLPEELSHKPILTEADTQEMAPYAYTVYPTDVLDFGVDDDGEFTWVLIRESYRNDIDPEESDGKVITQFRLWTRSEWRVYSPAENDKGWILKSSGSHPLAKVPVVRVVHKEGSDIYNAIGMIDDIAYKDRAIANYRSCLDCIIHDQTFSTLWIPDKGIVASTERDAQGKRQAMIRAATNRAAVFNDQAQHQPFYLSPDAAQAEIIKTLIEELRAEVWEDALMGSESRSKSTGPATATEKEHEFEKLNGALGDKAANLEAAERRILELVALWNGETPKEEELAAWSSYPRRFNIQALVDEISDLLQVQKITGLSQSPTFMTKVIERFIRRYLPDISEEDMDTIRTEIEGATNLQGLLAAVPMVKAGMAPPGGTGIPPNAAQPDKPASVV